MKKNGERNMQYETIILELLSRIKVLEDEVVQKTEMNRNSALMYLYAVSGMLDGTVYKRAINAKATRKYFDYILQEYGQSGLDKVLDATRQHIKYRKECGLTPDAIETLCDEYEQKE